MPKYLDSNSCMIFPGSAGVSPASEAARMAALPGYKFQEHHGIQITSRYLECMTVLLPNGMGLCPYTLSAALTQRRAEMVPHVP